MHLDNFARFDYKLNSFAKKYAECTIQLVYNAY